VLETIESRNRKLRLKVSKNALAKARQQAGAKSRASFGDRSSGSAGDPGHHHHTVIATPPAVHSSTTEAAPSEQRRERGGGEGGGGYLAQLSATPDSLGCVEPALPSEIEALFSGTGSRVNGKALLRLKKRYPDLGARLAEMQLQSAEPLDGVAADIAPERAARQAAFLGDATRHEQSHPLRKKRFRGRISRWMRSAKRAITHASRGTKRRT
jgi:hypothetical protein